MAASAPRATKRVRYAVHFGSTEEKDGFYAKLESIRQRMKPPGSRSIDNSLMNAMFDLVEKTYPLQQPDRTEVPTTCSFLRNSGKCIIVVI